jgi:hypothetical protein
MEQMGFQAVVAVHLPLLVQQITQVAMAAQDWWAGAVLEVLIQLELILRVLVVME